MSQKTGFIFLGGVFALFSFFVISQINFLMFHTFAELLSISVAWALFIILWNTKDHIENKALIFLGIAYLYIGGIDLIHTLSYKGMGILDSETSSNRATQLWICARYLQSISLCIFPFLFLRKIHPSKVFCVFTLFSVLCLLSIFYWDMFPVCYIEGAGLTTFKITSEYLICVILILALVFLNQKKKDIDRLVYKYIAISIVMAIFQEVAFTFYVNVYGLSIFFGHIFKIVSFYFLYLALIKSGLQRPYSLLFHELQRSKDLISEKEQFLKNIFESIQDGISVLTPDLSIQRVNGAMEKWYSKHLPLEGKKCFKCYHNADQPCDPCPTLRCLESGKPEKDDIPGLPGSDVEWLEVYSYPLKLIETGKTTGVIEFVRDITDRKAAEKSQREQKDFLNTLVETIPNPIFYKDAEGRYTGCNRAFEEFISKSSSQIIGKTVYDMGPMEMVEKYHQKDLELFSKPGRQQYEYTVETSNREVRDVIFDKATLHDTNGNVTGLVGIITDITRRKQREEKILRQKKFLTSVLDSLSHPFYVIDANNYTIVLANAASGVGPLEKNMTCHALTHKIDKVCFDKEHPCPLEQVKQTKKPAIAEHIHYDRQGNPRNIEIHGFPIFDKHGDVVQMISYGLDITEQRKAEEKIKNSLKEKDILLKELYHRTKNNMQVIMSMINLQTQNIEDESVLQLFKATLNRINSMALVHKKLYQAEDLSRLDLKEYIEDLVKFLSSSYKNKSEAIRINTKMESIHVKIDSAIPCGLIINELVSNAFKYAFPDHQKGMITIRLKIKADNQIELTVSDNGVGLPAGLDIRKSDTLGLKIVTLLIESQLQGTISVVRDGENGTHFLITFKEKPDDIQVPSLSEKDPQS